jgi:N-acetylglucosaminyl-diphospho-decaprenol L-rhamnosyltransferase
MISLIAITYNSRELLPRFLAALAATDWADYELIVVDNASSDGTAAWLAAEHPGVRVIASPANLGFGAACNLGFGAARGDLLVCMNPDVEVTPAWLAVLHDHMLANPAAAIICPSTLYPGDPPPAASGVAPTAAVPGCALMLRRSAWQEIGGFDEAMFLYWEDTELCWRAGLLGWQVLEDLDAIVYHERGGSTGGGRWEAEAAKNGLYAHLKLRRWGAIAHFSARLAAKTALRLLRGETTLLGAWRWNIGRLPATLRARRQLLGRARGDRRRLEVLIEAHARRGRRERRARNARA